MSTSSGAPDLVTRLQRSILNFQHQYFERAQQDGGFASDSGLLSQQQLVQAWLPQRPGAEDTVVLRTKGMPYCVSGVGDLLAMFRCLSCRTHSLLDASPFPSHEGSLDAPGRPEYIASMQQCPSTAYNRTAEAAQCEVGSVLLLPLFAAGQERQGCLAVLEVVQTLEHLPAVEVSEVLASVIELQGFSTCTRQALDGCLQKQPQQGLAGYRAAAAAATAAAAAAVAAGAVPAWPATPGPLASQTWQSLSLMLPRELMGRESANPREAGGSQADLAGASYRAMKGQLDAATGGLLTGAGGSGCLLVLPIAFQPSLPILDAPLYPPQQQRHQQLEQQQQHDGSGGGAGRAGGLAGPGPENFLGPGQQSPRNGERQQQQQQQQQVQQQQQQQAGAGLAWMEPHRGGLVGQGMDPKAEQ
ncbi:hypothetical protein N2152v2_006769 [Parachlorella kessleri]